MISTVLSLLISFVSLIIESLATSQLLLLTSAAHGCSSLSTAPQSMLRAYTCRGHTHAEVCAASSDKSRFNDCHQTSAPARGPPAFTDPTLSHSHLGDLYVQVLEAILDDDQDMQDMYLARRAEMAQMIAPDPDHPPDDPADSGLANLPSISSSGAAEATLAQALQSVAASQRAPAEEAAREASQEAPQEAAHEAAQEAAHNVVRRNNEEAGSHQWKRQGSGSHGLSQHPLEMAVPDHASLDSCLAAIMLICM